MNINSALSHYLNSLTNSTTRTNYKIVLDDFLEDILSLGDITSESILSYKGTLVGKAPQTIAARLAAIRSFCDYSWTQGWTDTDPSLSIKNNPVEKYSSAKNISFVDFKKILAKVDLSTLVGVRDYMLIRLIFSLGDPIKILRTPFNVDLPSRLQPLKDTYAQKLSKKTNVNSLQLGYLFFNLDKCVNAKPLSLSSCRKVLAKYVKRAGYPDKFLDFQAMKRLRAKQIYEQTNSEEAVQKFCGHKSLKVTKAFLRTLI
jgi:site-specific recombinase XerD